MNMKRNTAFFMAIFYFLSPVVGLQAETNVQEVVSTKSVSREGESTVKVAKPAKAGKKKGVFKKFSKKHLLLFLVVLIALIIGAGVAFKRRNQ